MVSIQINHQYPVDAKRTFEDLQTALRGCKAFDEGSVKLIVNGNAPYKVSIVIGDDNEDRPDGMILSSAYTGFEITRNKYIKDELCQFVRGVSK